MLQRIKIEVELDNDQNSGEKKGGRIVILYNSEYTRSKKGQVFD